MDNKDKVQVVVIGLTLFIYVGMSIIVTIGSFWWLITASVYFHRWKYLGYSNKFPNQLGSHTFILETSTYKRLVCLGTFLHQNKQVPDYLESIPPWFFIL